MTLWYVGSGFSRDQMLPIVTDSSRTCHGDQEVAHGVANGIWFALPYLLFGGILVPVPAFK
jgi:hypothetical protein